MFSPWHHREDRAHLVDFCDWASVAIVLIIGLISKRTLNRMTVLECIIIDRAPIFADYSCELVELVAGQHDCDTSVSSYIKADRYKKSTRHDADYKDRDVVCLCTGANLEQGPILVLCVHPESQDPIGSALVHICRNKKNCNKDGELQIRIDVPEKLA